MKTQFSDITKLVDYVVRRGEQLMAILTGTKPAR